MSLGSPQDKDNTVYTFVVFYKLLTARRVVNSEFERRIGRACRLDRVNARSQE